VLKEKQADAKKLDDAQKNKVITITS
jgi:hypothetical protein